MLEYERALTKNIFSRESDEDTDEIRKSVKKTNFQERALKILVKYERASKQNIFLRESAEDSAEIRESVVEKLLFKRERSRYW